MLNRIINWTAEHKVTVFGIIANIAGYSATMLDYIKFGATFICITIPSGIYLYLKAIEAWDKRRARLRIQLQAEIKQMERDEPEETESEVVK